MSSDVFLKHLRKMNYETLYNDEQWHNRTLTTTVYELREGERWDSMRRNGTLSEYLAPSDAMQENSKLAAGMGTTLWFTAADKEKGMPQAIMADGQYTMCYNLLEYIDKVQEDGANLTEGHQQLIALRPQLMEMWNKFQQDPQWMVPKDQ